MQSQESTKLAEIFGVSRSIPLSYRARESVDSHFLTSLARDKHIVIYGGSKQGKTCLRKRCLRDQDCVVVQCRNDMGIGQLYCKLLKEAGASVTISPNMTSSGRNKVQVHLNGQLTYSPLQPVKDGVGVTFDIDPGDVSDIIRVLEKGQFDRYVVLEDFHYLTDDVQRVISYDLKTFHENSKLCFIVVGVWTEANHLVMYNGDLSGRLIPINAARWSEEELDSVLRSGEQLLNVFFAPATRQAVIEGCQGNVGVLQECAYRLCESASRTEGEQKPLVFDDLKLVYTTLKEIAHEQAGQTRELLTSWLSRNRIRIISMDRAENLKRNST